MLKVIPVYDMIKAKVSENMKIGLDLDGVVFDSERIFRVCAELYDVNVLHKYSVIDNREVKFQDRFDWTKEEMEDFMNKNQTNIIKKSPFMPGAKEVLKLLKQNGHELVIITARGYKVKEHIAITQDILKQNDMDIFDNYFWGIENKEEICLQEKIDLMIEDSNTKCKILSDNKIKTIYFKDAPNFDMEENEYLKVLYNWGEIYRYIMEG